MIFVDVPVRAVYTSSVPVKEVLRSDTSLAGLLVSHAKDVQVGLNGAYHALLDDVANTQDHPQADAVIAFEALITPGAKYAPGQVKRFLHYFTEGMNDSSWNAFEKTSPEHAVVTTNLRRFADVATKKVSDVFSVQKHVFPVQSYAEKSSAPFSSNGISSEELTKLLSNYDRPEDSMWNPLSSHEEK